MPITPLDLFIRASDALVKFEAHYNALNSEEIDRYDLEVRSEEIQKLWAQAHDMFGKCLDYLMSSVDAKKEDIDSVDSKYEVSYQTYLRCLSAIRRKLGQLKRSREASVNSTLDGSVVSLGQQSVSTPLESRVNISSSTQASHEVGIQVDSVAPSVKSFDFGPIQSDSVHNLALPPCDTDVFEGDFHSWPTFRDLFTAVYINNARLSDIERLCHLVRKTSGEAREIVSKFPLTNRSFVLAWKSLKETYDNPRVIVHNQLKILFSLPVIDIETSSNLKSLQRGINGCLSAMSIYDISTDNWDPIIVFLCLQRLPKITQTLWEQSVKNKSSLSLWKDLDGFLSERIQTLMCLHDMRSNDPTKRTTKKVQSHFTNTDSSAPSQPTSESNSRKSGCVLCPNKNHRLFECSRFRSLSASDRYKLVKRHYLCVNCLRKGHEVKKCDSNRHCSKCNQPHHTLLHRIDANSNNSAPVNSIASNSSSVHPPLPIEQSLPSTSAGCVPRQAFHLAQNKSVLLGTAMVTIVLHGFSYSARALIDPASESSFLSERLQKRLKLPVHSTNASISGVNGTVSATSHKLCTLKIGSPINSRVILETTALVLPSISGNIPSFNVSSDLRAQIPDLQLADFNLFDSRPVDLLLGADLYPNILLDGCRPILSGRLLAQYSIFGWLVTGPVPTTEVRTFATTIDVVEEDSLNKTLLRFWELEEPPKRKMMSPSDRFCEDNYLKTTRRMSDGRYIVTLPIKPDIDCNEYLGNSREIVLKQYLRSESSLLRKSDVKVVYDKVLKEYLDLGHMRLVSPNLLNDTLYCYLPHHPVINPDKQTTKLRVVFNASFKTSSGKSLNDLLYVGPTLQLDLVLLILRWRIFKFVFNSDITQMYRQIRVDPKHTPLQRILFRDSPSKPVQDYELQTVTFGVNCAPYLAIRTLLQLAKDTETEFPIAAHILRKCMYVDDVLAGSHDLETAVTARDQLISALSTAKFELRKWTSNNRSILEGIPSDQLLDHKILSFVESSSSKPLGIRWNAHLDTFYFEVAPIAKKATYTKREVLSAIAKLFDPVGWLGPVLVVAKMVMQKVWLDNIGWDDTLLPATYADWRQFVNSYTDVNSVKVPRWVQYTPNCSAELHVFSDASEKAYAGVIYIRIESPSGSIFVHLLSCKTRVAPIKSISLPRLELCGAVLASELLKTIVSEIDIEFRQVYCWTDSTIVLSWLRKTPSTWTTFVANRVCRIQENVGNHNWYHVKSEDNPADLGSRGSSPLDLANSSLWWHGPSWLRDHKSKWLIRDLSVLETDTERRSVKSHASFLASSEDLLVRFSCLGRALRVISYIFRFFHRTHPRHRNNFVYTGDIASPTEIDFVRSRLIILAQQMYYADEYRDLSQSRPLDRKSSLAPLNPFLDESGIIRMNGRLVNSPTLAYTERHPTILPYHCRFVKLLVEFVHKISVHGGNQLMLRILRIEYWVPRLKSLIRLVINRCRTCILQKKRSINQVMAALPPERTVIDRPFSTTGVDFAGPFEVKAFTGRACKITKGYVCVFVCFSTKAIHLEAVSDLSTANFLAAFHRFVARRGCPRSVFSDNGTNFVGASRELERNFRAFLRDCSGTISSNYAIHGLSWQFIPAGAPHMGGLWEAGVKSFKLHFRKQVRNLRYTFEELATVLARIEACLNSRPLCPMSDSSTDIVALTPGHFLIGAPLLAPPEPSIAEQPLSIVNRFRKVQALVHQFCLRWKEEYLKSLHMRYKWKFPQRDIQKDDIVVIRHETLPPTSWKLGRIENVYPGPDGHTRVADVRIENSVVRRPITKLVVLTE